MIIVSSACPVGLALRAGLCQTLAMLRTRVRWPSLAELRPLARQEIRNDCRLFRKGRCDFKISLPLLREAPAASGWPAQTAGDWESVLRVDLLGAFFFIKHAFRQMQHGGAIVNVSSIDAVETDRWAALEGKPKGIRINAVVRDVGKPEDVVV